MNAPSRRPEALFLIGTFLVATFCLSTFEITEHDYWWHLATGKYIIENGTIPREDVFSFTAAKPWIAHYWLADVTGYALYCLIDTPGMILLNAFLITVSFWIVLKVVRSRGAGLLLSVIVVLIAVYASRSRFYVRPETCSFILMALYLGLFYHWRRRGGMLALLLFPLLQLLWVNLYGGGSVVGLILLFCFVIGEALNALFALSSESRLPRCEVVKLGVSAFAAFCLSFVNPNTYRTVFYFLMSRDPIFRHIVEWRRFELQDLLSLHGLLLFLGIFLLIRFIKRMDFTELALFITFAYMSIDAPRSLPFFAIAAAPLIAGRLQCVLEPLVRRIAFYPALKRSGRLVSAVCSFGILAVTFWYLFRDVGEFHRDYAFGLSINKKLFPIEAVDFLEEHNIKGPLFNSYGIGGYLIWRLYPKQKIFLDGRVEMYGTDFLKKYMIYWHPDVWEDYVRDYGIQCAIIDREPNYTTGYLDDSPEWRLVFFDDRAMIYLKNVPENAELIERYGYRYLRPGSLQFDYLDQYLSNPVTGRPVIEEIKRSFHDEIYNLNAHLMLGYCYLRLGGEYLSLALDEYRAALSLMPEGRDIQRKVEWLEMVTASRL